MSEECEEAFRRWRGALDHTPELSVAFRTGWELAIRAGIYAYIVDLHERVREPYESQRLKDTLSEIKAILNREVC